MRKLNKLGIPEILKLSHDTWLLEFKSEPSNNNKKYKYRHPKIKQTLLEETGSKCIYCESKIGSTSPGDIEHKVPSSKNIDLHFKWENLTIACNECNRRKNDYYDGAGKEFLDPYIDDVEKVIDHRGPILGWEFGNQRAEITVRILELNSERRLQLIIRKIEKIGELNNLFERYKRESSIDLKMLIKLDILRMTDIKSEFSAMIISIIKKIKSIR